MELNKWPSSLITQRVAASLYLSTLLTTVVGHVTIDIDQMTPGKKGSETQQHQFITRVLMSVLPRRLNAVWSYFIYYLTNRAQVLPDNSWSTWDRPLLHRAFKVEIKCNHTKQKLQIAPSTKVHLASLRALTLNLLGIASQATQSFPTRRAHCCAGCIVI